MIDLLSEPLARLVIFTVGAGSIACVLGLLIGGNRVNRNERVLCDRNLSSDGKGPDDLYLPFGSNR